VYVLIVDVQGAEEAQKILQAKLKVKTARRKISKLEAKDAKIAKQITDLEKSMFQKHGKEADTLYRRIRTLTAKSKEIMRQIDLVLQKLPKKEAAKIVMVERELGGKLTETEKWARKKRLK